jgi:dTDP-D-glucose 4,6-dehydratase
VYNIGASSEKTNLEVVELICSFLDEQQPRRDVNRIGSKSHL